MYKEKTEAYDGPCKDAGSPVTANQPKPLPYTTQINDLIIANQDIARAIREKSVITAGGRQEVCDDCDIKEQEPFNFSEATIKELRHLRNLLSEIYEDMDRFV